MSQSSGRLSSKLLSVACPRAPRCEALEPRVLLSGVTTAAALEPVYEAPAPTGDAWRVDFNRDGVIDAHDVAPRPGAARAGESSLRIGGQYASDPVPGNASLRGVVVAGYGQAGASVVLGSGPLSGAVNVNGQVEQGDLDAVLQNWGSSFSVHDNILGGSTTETRDLLSSSIAYAPYGAEFYDDVSDFILTATPPAGQTSLRSDDPRDRGDAAARGRGLQFTWNNSQKTGELSAVVGFEQAAAVMQQGTFLPLGLSVPADGSREYEVRVEWDNGWGDPFAQGVGAAITSDGELALVAGGGYTGQFEIEVVELRPKGTELTRVDERVTVAPAGNQAPRPVVLPTEIVGDVGGVWRFQLPDRDRQGEPVRYDVSFGVPGDGTYRFDAEAYVDADNVLTIDRETIREMMLARQQYAREVVQRERQVAAYHDAFAEWRDADGDSSSRPLWADFVNVDPREPGVGFDSTYLQSMPFELLLSTSDGWSVTTQTATLMFAPPNNPAPAIGLADVTASRATDTYTFNVPAYDAQGDAVEYDLWTSTGVATLTPFVRADEHRVTFESPYLGIEPIRLRVTMSDGGLPVQESFVLWTSRAGTPAPYIEIPDQVRDAAQGTIITVRLPPEDRDGEPFSYEAILTTPDANGELPVTWREPKISVNGWGQSDEYGGRFRVGGDSRRAYDALFDAHSPIMEHGRVFVRSNRIGIVVMPDYVGDLAVMIRATHGDTTIYDTFKVTVDRASTPRPLDALLGVTRDVFKPADRRGHFQPLPKVNDRGQPIRYTVRSSTGDWVSLTHDAAGRFGVNVVPVQGFGGSFGITLIAETSGGRVERRWNHHVDYTPGARSEALTVGASSAGRVLPGMNDVTRSMLDAPWTLPLPVTHAGKPVTYDVRTTSGPWARVNADGSGRPVLGIYPPQGFRGGFLVQVDAMVDGTIDREVFEFTVPL